MDISYYDDIGELYQVFKLMIIMLQVYTNILETPNCTVEHRKRIFVKLYFFLHAWILRKN